MKLTVRKSPQKKYLIAIAIFFISLSENSMATSLNSSSECAVHFIGTVQSVIEPSAPFSIQSQKLEITFKVDEDIDSQEEVGESYSFKVIKGGPHEFKEGYEYEVYADSGYLCSSQIRS